MGRKSRKRLVDNEFAESSSDSEDETPRIRLWSLKVSDANEEMENMHEHFRNDDDTFDWVNIWGYIIELFTDPELKEYVENHKPKKPVEVTPIVLEYCENIIDILKLDTNPLLDEELFISTKVRPPSPQPTKGEERQIIKIEPEPEEVTKVTEPVNRFKCTVYLIESVYNELDKYNLKL